MYVHCITLFRKLVGPLAFTAVHFENLILATKTYAVLKIEDLKKTNKQTLRCN